MPGSAGGGGDFQVEQQVDGFDRVKDPVEDELVESDVVDVVHDSTGSLESSDLPFFLFSLFYRHRCPIFCKESMYVLTSLAILFSKNYGLRK